MGFSCGIVGLPNVGKSTIFNALTKSQIEASNYPFCTIDPNHGVVTVPDNRLSHLSQINQSQKIFPTTVEFIDIAGLVKGASKGEGLGNQFLSHIREVNAICHVVRLFSDQNITHVGQINPIENIDTIDTELILADIEKIEKKILTLKKNARGQNKKAEIQLNFLNNLNNFLLENKPARFFLDQYPSPRLYEIEEILKELQLITIKPLLILANIDESYVAKPQESPYYKDVIDYCQKNKCQFITLSAKMEKELCELEPKELEEMLESEGIETTGINKLIIGGYQLLDLITFFTSGKKETRAWTLKKGSYAPQAAGKIHSDFEKGFIRAETVTYNDLNYHGSYLKCKEKGKIRMEGKDYIVKDGDIFNFHFS